MAVQTYCVRADVEAIISKHGVDAFVDDDQDGLVSTTEESYVTAAIERAATKINFYLQRRYKQADIVSNDWLTFANAVMAACNTSTRRGNPDIASLQAECDDYIGWLEDIQNKQADLPNQTPSADFTATVTNYDVERARGTMPVRVVQAESTGEEPDTSRKRKTARQIRDVF